jgi:N-acetylglucosaminyl-diphospho-decaprenol L-rhamnosyltransferase
MHDLAIIIVSTNEARWLEPCLSTVFAHAGGASLDVVVVDNSSTDGTPELVESRFPAARVVHSVNRGFAHANNQGAVTTDARYVLFLNPDTEIVNGTFGELVATLDARPEIGLAGVRQLTGDGELFPTIRRFPTIPRAVGQALSVESWPVQPAWAGERELDMDVYEGDVPCDWTSGSYMLARREALWSAGLMDERFFIYCEEPDLCLRIKQAGWDVWHLSAMTIIHHAGKGGVRPKMIAQDAYARRQYAAKHFSPVKRLGYLGVIGAGLALRAVASRGELGAQKKEAAKRALGTLLGRVEPPFGAPVPTAFPVEPKLEPASRNGGSR